MKKMITICAECKKVLKVSCGVAVEEAFASLDEEVIYSHGICRQCGLKLYGAELIDNYCGR